jgi:hypothetical protein
LTTKHHHLVASNNFLRRCLSPVTLSSRTPIACTPAAVESAQATGPTLVPSEQTDVAA